jgi:hypothetical protein
MKSDGGRRGVQAVVPTPPGVYIHDTSKAWRRRPVQGDQRRRPGRAVSRPPSRRRFRPPHEPRIDDSLPAVLTSLKRCDQPDIIPCLTRAHDSLSRGRIPRARVGIMGVGRTEGQRVTPGDSKIRNGRITGPNRVGHRRRRLVVRGPSALPAIRAFASQNGGMDGLTGSCRGRHRCCASAQPAVEQILLVDLDPAGARSRGCVAAQVRTRALVLDPRLWFRGLYSVRCGCRCALASRLGRGRGIAPGCQLTAGRSRARICRRPTKRCTCQPRFAGPQVNASAL